MRRTLALVLLAPVLLFACGSNGSDGAAPVRSTTSTTSTTAGSAEQVLDILVTNDDGFAAPGIDALVEALRALPDTTVTVVAPAANESGSGDATTPGSHVRARVKTASGYAATAVEGKPADSVHVALDVLHLRPDLVVSGANLGQNVGPSTKRSGTVGAALTAARTGIPALAVSAASTAPDFAHAAELVVGWVNDHRRAILAGTEPAEVTSLNVPTCPGGPRGTVVEPTATALAGRRPDHVRCHSQADEGSFADDVDAFVHGYAVFAPVPK